MVIISSKNKCFGYPYCVKVRSFFIRHNFFLKLGVAALFGNVWISDFCSLQICLEISSVLSFWYVGLIDEFERGVGLAYLWSSARSFAFQSLSLTFEILVSFMLVLANRARLSSLL